MKLGHIVKYHDVFFKFDNGPYRTMLSAVVVPLLSTMMSSSSSIMGHIAPCFQQLWPFVYEKITVLNNVRSLSRKVLIRIL